ncbi:MAG: F0F1 ATP synthase subunit epsilon [Flavobacteriia bacterium]|nr:F0F1 ATP synthase subunit epsilon [Flavobacteriia bacterium]
MHLEIITPDTKIFKGEVDAVQLPGLDGSFQVLKNHAPIISALGKGTVKIDLTTSHETHENLSELVIKDSSNNKVIRVDINGGVLEMLGDKIILLAE